MEIIENEIQDSTLFVDVILPLNLNSTYTYRVPKGWEDDIQIGIRVAVNLGNTRIYSGLVSKVHYQAPNLKSIKYILSIIDHKPIITQNHLKFWKWISNYYMASIGEVMMAAIPANLRLKSQSIIQIHPEFEGDISSLNENELEIFDLILENTIQSIEELQKKTKNNKTFNIVNKLTKEKILISQEQFKDKRPVKKENWVRLSKEYQNEDKLKELFTLFESKKTYEKQYYTLIAFLSKTLARDSEIRKVDLDNDNMFNSNSFNTMLSKGIFSMEVKDKSRLIQREATHSLESLHLNPEQLGVYNKIIENWDKLPVSLIHGVTGSGKTEIYIKLIEKVIASGKQVLYLLPEIALTSHLIHRLSRYFGARVGVFHSRFSREEQEEIYYKVNSQVSEVYNYVNEEDNKSYDIILGARSSIFLPFYNLGLIIVDEEHDTSYKQYDPSPRYNARDSALILAKLFNAKTILGSATPSVETYFNAKQGRYELLEIHNRYLGTKLPKIQVSDFKLAKKEKRVHSHFTSELIEEINIALKNKNQVLLFQNRRGFALEIKCQTCGAVPHCKNCDVALTYHKSSELLKCHYCSYSQPITSLCNECGSQKIDMMGFGTQKVEQEIEIFFPQAKIARLDLDTTRTKNSYEEIIGRFEKREIDILVGTQMITKGLDFGNVALVGILNADSLLYYPDFRSIEKAFQMITQVSGRAGRSQKQGLVIIQTFSPNHPVIKYSLNYDFDNMYCSQIIDRKFFNYPPYCRLIQISIKHVDSKVLDIICQDFKLEVNKLFGQRILGPEYPPIPRIRNMYCKNFLLKLDKSQSHTSAKAELWKICEEFLKLYPKIRISIDVDPV